jgi:hypothetical protein
MEQNDIIGISLLSFEMFILFITCIALFNILIKGRNKSWWGFQKFVEMNGNKLIPWHFWFFVFQLVITVTGTLLIVQ